MPSSTKASPYETDSLGLTNDLHHRVLAHVRLKLLFQVGCNNKEYHLTNQVLSFILKAKSMEKIAGNLTNLKLKNVGKICGKFSQFFSSNQSCNQQITVKSSHFHENNFCSFSRQIKVVNSKVR